MVAKEERPPTDGEAVAVFHLLSMTFERELLRSYLTWKDKYPQIVHCAREAIKDVQGLSNETKGKAGVKKRAKVACPPGMEKCTDGRCAAMC